jgi:hypothetical protein
VEIERENSQEAIPVSVKAALLTGMKGIKGIILQAQSCHCEP